MEEYPIAKAEDRQPASSQFGGIVHGGRGLMIVGKLVGANDVEGGSSKGERKASFLVPPPRLGGYKLIRN